MGNSNIIKFNTVGLFTKDLYSMVAFYRDIFSFKTDWNGKEPNVELYHDDMHLIMFRRNDFETMTTNTYSYPKGLNGTMELFFSVPLFADVDKEFERVTKAGAKSVVWPITEPWGQRTCWVADPDGNLIEISSFQEK